jgi:hypothetical protein
MAKQKTSRFYRRFLILDSRSDLLLPVFSANPVLLVARSVRSSLNLVSGRFKLFY